MSGQHMKLTSAERIALIAKKSKTAAYTLVAVLLIAAVAVGCTFTGPQGEPGIQTGEDEAPLWAEADVARWKSEIVLTGLTAQADGSYGEIGRQWAETFAAQYLGTSPDNPLSSSDCAVLSCELYAESLLSTPKELIFNMRFACLAADANSFERWYVGWAGPLSDAEYPQYAGWMEFGWFVVLKHTGDGHWTCADAGTGGYAGWGYLNYEETRDLDDQMEHILSGDEMAEIPIRALPFVDWPAFEDRWGVEGWNALLQMLEDHCLSEGQVYGPEDTRMWSDVYPDDQIYRNLYVMLAALNADGDYFQGLTDILLKQREHDPAAFEVSLQNLPPEQGDIIRSAVETD